MHHSDPPLIPSPPTDITSTANHHAVASPLRHHHRHSAVTTETPTVTEPPPSPATSASRPTFLRITIKLCGCYTKTIAALAAFPVAAATVAGYG
nr:hypothetical protein [Tanacetum cinerariifolium]